MRIALLCDRIPPESRGGAEVVAWRLAGGLAAAGHDVHVIAATPGQPFEQLRAGIPTYHLRAAYPQRFRAWLSLWNPQTIPPLRHLLRRLQPDVASAHNIHHFLSYRALYAAQNLGIPTVLSAQDCMAFAYGKLRHFVRADAEQMRLPADYRLPRGYNLRENRFRYNPWRNRVIRHCLTHKADLLTAGSQALADACLANDLPPMEVARAGLDAAPWRVPDPAALESLTRKTGLDDKQVILIAGRLTAEKGTLALLNAMERIRDRRPDMRLLALSSRDITRQIPARYRHMTPLIQAAGWLEGDELRAAYHLADVVVTPSIVFDAFPTVNLEAMAAGRPVIATCFGGSSEAVIDGETGFIVNPLDADAFADRLLRLLSDEGLRRRMGRSGLQRVKAHFSLEQQVSRMLDVYQRAIAMRQSRARENVK